MSLKVNYLGDVREGVVATEVSNSTGSVKVVLHHSPKTKLNDLGIPLMAGIEKIVLSSRSVVGTASRSEFGFHTPLILMTDLSVIERIPKSKGFSKMVRNLNPEISAKKTNSRIEQKALRDYALRKLDLYIVRLSESELIRPR